MEKLVMLLEEYLSALKGYSNESPDKFSELFSLGVAHNNLSDADVAKRFGANRSTANRWRNGAAAPPPAMRLLVLGELETITEAKVRRHKKQRAETKVVRSKSESFAVA